MKVGDLESFVAAKDKQIEDMTEALDAAEQQVASTQHESAALTDKVAGLEKSLEQVSELEVSHHARVNI